MRGLDPRINAGADGMDGRIKSGHDEGKGSRVAG